MFLFFAQKFCTSDERGRRPFAWEQPPVPITALTACLMPGGPEQAATLPTGRWKARARAFTPGTHRWRVCALSRDCPHAQTASAALVQLLCAWKMAACLAGPPAPCTPCVPDALALPQRSAFCPGSCRTGTAVAGKCASA